MITPEFPSNEAGRLAALRALRILDTPQEQRFDRITAFARELFQVPIALVSLVDQDRQWFKSRAGLDAAQTPRSVSFCGHAILTEDIFVVEDATVDERFSDNPLVTGPPFVRFYAGMPLNAHGYRMGTLCVIGNEARRFEERDRNLLRMLAGWVERELVILSDLEAMAIRLESQARLEAVLNGIADGVLMADSSGVVSNANPAAARIFAIAEKEFVGKHFHELLPARDRGANAEYLRKLNAIPDPLVRTAMEIVGLRSDGTEFPLEISFSRLNINGHRMYSGILRDLTERKDRAHIEALVASRTRELRESEGQTRAILDNIVDGIINIDEQGSIVAVNPAGERIFGYSAAELIGRNVKMLMPEPYRSEHDGYLRNYLATEEAKVIGIGREVIGRRKDGSTFPMELAVSVIEHNGLRMFTGIVRDISERKRIETMKSEFISTVSHELRTPLTSIRGSLDLIIDGMAGEISEEVREMISIAHNNSERLIRLINDLLDMEKFDAGQMQFDLKPVRLDELLKSAVVDNLGYAAQYDIRFDIPDDIPDVHLNVDKGRLLQVLTNLLSNAAKFSPAQGIVSVSAQLLDGRVRIAVKDRGPGIPLEFQDRIFGKFAQADSSDSRQKGGTGLGLNITKAIVERHGGTIGFDTTTGGGTTFYFELPVWVEPAVLAGANPAAEVPERARILVCEDDKDIAKLLSMMLHQGGYLPDVAYSAAQAKQMLSVSRYAAMTLDLGLPDQDGVSLIRELRAQASTQNLPIVVISAKADQGRLELNGDAIGILDWLQKPIDAGRLANALRVAMRFSTGDRPRILHVEDDADIVSVVARMVGDRATLIPASTLRQAIDRLAQERFDLVILDLGLPDGSGEDLLPYIRNGKAEGTPVIIFSAQDLSAKMAESVERALVKSRTTNDELLRTINSFITRIGRDYPGAIH